MTIRVDFQVLEVGQGMCNFVEVYDGEDNSAEILLTTLLFDAGSQTRGDIQPGARASVGYIVRTLTDMAQVAEDRTARMGALVLSHSDSDHINLLPRIFDEFDPPSEENPTKTVLALEYIFYSGHSDRYDKTKNIGGRDILNIACRYLVGPAAERCQSFGYNGTGLNDGDPRNWSVLYRLTGRSDSGSSSGSGRRFSSGSGSGSGSGSDSGSEDETTVLGIYPITVNTAQGVDDTDYDPKLPAVSNVNSGCLVALLQLEDNGEPLRIVVSGDATAETMTRCTLNVARSSGPLNAFHLTLPHHGSGSTTFNLNVEKRQKMIDEETASESSEPSEDLVLLGKREVKDEARENLKDFVAAMSAKTVSASAGPRTSFNHPEALVLRYFLEALDKVETHYEDPELGARHFITASFEEDLCRELTSGSGSSDNSESSGEMEVFWPPEEGWGVVQTVCNIFTTQYVLAENKTEKKLDGRKRDVEGSQSVVLRNTLKKGVWLVSRDSVDPDAHAPQGVNWTITLIRRDDGSGVGRVSRWDHGEPMESTLSAAGPGERYGLMASARASRRAAAGYAPPLVSLQRIG